MSSRSIDATLLNADEDLELWLLREIDGGLRYVVSVGGADFIYDDEEIARTTFARQAELLDEQRHCSRG